MSYLSQFLAGNTRIGDIITMPEMGHKYTRGNEVWVHTGTLFPAASYSRAAAESLTMVNGLASSGLTAAAIGISLATNGTGTWVLADSSSATQIRYSTNNGQTWSSANHNNTNQVNTVVYNAGVTRFVAFGNSNTAITASYSTTGTSGWTSGGSNTPAFTPVANSVRAATDGTNIVAAWSSSSSSHNTCVTTTNGTTLTSRTLATNIGTGLPLVASLPTLSPARFIIVNTVSRAVQASSASDGSMWAAAITLDSTMMGGSNSIVGAAGGNGVYMVAGRAGYATSPDATTWTYYNYPGTLSSATAVFDNFAPGKFGSSYPNWLRYEGGAFITGSANAADFANAAQGVFGYCDDNVSFKVRQLTYPTDAAANAQWIVASGNGYLVTAPAGAAFSSNVQNSQYSASWLTAADYVGRARPILPATVASSATIAAYVRLQ
jgi:hypothetical protein